MTKRMLIDTTHAEETRVVVMDGDRVEDYDVETSTKKQLKGNIYLAKVIRVEPSLQAAFVEYGGNRHGFLAFSEIHPDYFQIPVADREKLIALQEEEIAERGDAEDAADNETVSEDASESEDGDNHDRRAPETVGGEHDTGEESASSRRTARFLRNYKIQEVIRRRQVLLVQVVKEERGNKGAALTTYISLAGRYCVLMPNALRGGGVSRKITSDADRRRLRDVIAELDLPKSMAMIVRTAGAGRSAQEVTRDCEYLLQLWDDIRSHALSSVAPTLVYEEASLIKRVIRDLFSKDIEDILVDGEAAWKSAREFMRLLMPSNANKVKLWQNRGQSLFARYNVEHHLDAMFSPTARLPSGGYLVINQTEALVAIDVNSGKSTSQRNIEETALRTNLEAAEEVGRQLRLRDLAGLVVIDFIDMESRRHNAQVEKRLKEALRSDRARIQVGHISHFGLLEMSRQRLRPSIAESVLTPCPHCQGTGFIRGTESSALHVLRAIDEEGARQRSAEIEVYVGSEIALYILNHKRSWLADIERHHRMQVIFRTEENLAAADMRIERLKAQIPAPAQARAPERTERTMERAPESVRTIEIIEEQAPVAPRTETPVVDAEIIEDVVPSEGHEDSNDGRRRRRRRRRGGRREHNGDVAADAPQDHIVHAPEERETPVADSADENGIIPGRRRTRFKRVVRETEGSEAPHAEPVAEARDVAPRRPAPAARPAAPAPVARNPRRWEEREERPVQHRYTGPTPADPFGGSFDIFDVIEQAEFEGTTQALQTGISIPADVVIEHTPAVETVVVVEEPAVEAPVAEAPATEEAAKPRRGRGRRPARAKAVDAAPAETVAEAPAADVAPAVEESATEEAPKPRRTRARRAPKTVAAEAPAEPAAEIVAAPVEVAAEEPAKPKRGRTRRTPKAAAVETPAEDGNILQPVNIDEVAPAKRRAGWWKR
ncbi:MULTISPECIES: Rne/Rng family ribonuclease [Gluconobacter]|uniref:Ribonuclease E n=1 Tax=Gluconobacter cadivus TaxID=2728101 RepID=A0ABR9YT49_9PROT|nr:MULTISPECIES: Rne/Rng family ribonuclease [Gluconobacter]MBF0887717.1 Rne/Rng family ribonuclease [Gluconobacter cadivus]MBS1058787.1 Rne/Rng family ribonuclease [Gluconobacter sp. Dm-44]